MSLPTGKLAHGFSWSVSKTTEGIQKTILLTILKETVTFVAYILKTVIFVEYNHQTFCTKPNGRLAEAEIDHRSGIIGRPTSFFGRSETKVSSP